MDISLSQDHNLAPKEKRGIMIVKQLKRVKNQFYLLETLVAKSFIYCWSKIWYIIPSLGIISLVASHAKAQNRRGEGSEKLKKKEH